MKRVILLLGIIICTLQGNAQLVQKEDGLYYDHNDKPYSGTYIEYYPSGQIRVEMSVDEGKRHGKSVYYYEDGKKQEVRVYANNEMDGTWFSWNKEGIKVSEANYKNGLKHGKWLIWDDNGKMRYEMFYDEGHKVGTWKSWNETGDKISEKKY